MRRWGQWFRQRAQRIGFALILVTLAFALGAGVLGGLRLRDARDLERRIVRTQQLQSAALELQFAESRGSGAQRAAARAAVAAAFADLARHDPATAERLRPALAAGSTARLQGEIQRELAADSRQTLVANPATRSALIAAAAATALLVLELGWQFELARRAGRIDRNLAARAEELARLRSSLVGIVSHELRTPLTSIIGYLELLDERDTGPLTDEQATYLGSARRSADRLASLVDELLTLTEAGRSLLDLETQTVDAAALVREAVTAAQPAADTRSLRLVAAGDDAVPVVGDPRRLGQMLDNLVSNAIKFTPAGGKVSVRALREEDGVTFEVRDSGHGISATEREQLFVPFFRGADATRDAVPGTGLGLTITKAIVDAHRGTISIESVPDRGTTFRVHIPHGLVPSADAEPGAETAPAGFPVVDAT
ncbi:MAG: HAMP domain-containing histidine kinase [Actinobacteria bacterium]|nr:HAMP domain-containing histidine kinase [Actinomycetota bacterium]